MHLLSSADDTEPEVQLHERSPVLTPFSDEPHPSTSTLFAEDIPSMPSHYVPRRRTTFFKSFPNSPTQERAKLSSVDSTPPSSLVSPAPSEASDSDTEALPEPNVEHRPSYSFFHHARRRIRRGWVALNDFMTVPLWASIASLIVACVRPLQNLLDNHMEPVKGALATAGNCSIPLTLVVLGAYFYVPPEEVSGRGPIALPTSRSADSLADSFRDMVFFKRRRLSRQSSELVAPGETKTVIITVLSRMLITPLLLLPLMAASAKFDWHKVLEE